MLHGVRYTRVSGHVMFLTVELVRELCVAMVVVVVEEDQEEEVVVTRKNRGGSAQHATRADGEREERRRRWWRWRRLSLFGIRSQICIRPTRIRRNTDPNHGCYECVA